MTRTETYLSHEDSIALKWLKLTERQLERNTPHLVSSLTNSFESIVSDWEESGKLRANHRKLDLDAAKSHASSQLKSGAFPLTLRHFTAEQEAKSEASVEKAAKDKLAQVLKSTLTDRDDEQFKNP